MKTLNDVPKGEPYVILLLATALGLGHEENERQGDERDANLSWEITLVKAGNQVIATEDLMPN
jgi:hypothetical protein